MLSRVCDKSASLALVRNRRAGNAQWILPVDGSPRRSQRMARSVSTSDSLHFTMSPGSESLPRDRHVLEVDRRLRTYGSPSHHNREDPLDELVFVILSAQTEEYLYLRTFEQLARCYPGWAGLAEASVADVERIIQAGGLFRKKARQLVAALSQIVSDVGYPSLAFLRELDDESTYRYLVSLPGVSRKTALCIMMYSLGRAVLPVDTHVWRIARRLHWTPPKPKPTPRDGQGLEALIPAGVRHSLHVNMVAHGRTVCLPYNPRCDTCVLADLCPSRGRPDDIWINFKQPRGVWSPAPRHGVETASVPIEAGQVRSVSRTDRHLETCPYSME